ncbi:hypothetical protein A0H81_10094 [Grifola frondosa]|uniref:Uncharacterized protein n=1 Tax=Grifola frondosa TaxID=5627 RepID=A0A1C7LZD7_GRIFR|nr:hypothetical protein A0H81_10094 [Grifola frondosa]
MRGSTTRTTSFVWRRILQQKWWLCSSGLPRVSGVLGTLQLSTSGQAVIPGRLYAYQQACVPNVSPRRYDYFDPISQVSTSISICRERYSAIMHHR